MAELSVLIPAAGRGSRAGLPYPKTLFPVDGTPILHRLLAVMSPYDARPTVVVSPQGESMIRMSLDKAGLNALCVLQAEPLGMGNAVLCSDQSPTISQAEHILLAWGDIVNLQSFTVSSLVDSHFANDNDFTFVTSVVDQAYTIVHRDATGNVLSVSESREDGSSNASCAERDIGLFIFRRKPVFSILRADLNGRFGTTTGEHGFLYVIEHLVRSGFRVSGLPIASVEDLVSLNALSDLN